MKKQIAILATSAVLLAVALFLLVNSFSPNFQKCAFEYGKNEASSSQDKDLPVSRVAPYIYCMGDFIDHNNGSITTLATIIIAAFTGTLWRATTEQGRLTKDALVADKRHSFLQQASVNFGRSTNPVRNTVGDFDPYGEIVAIRQQGILEFTLPVKFVTPLCLAISILATPLQILGLVCSAQNMKIKVVWLLRFHSHLFRLMILLRSKKETNFCTSWVGRNILIFSLIPRST